MNLTNANNADQLKEQEFVFKSILEGTMAGYWDWFIPKNYEYLSPTFKSMFGYEDHEMENHPDSWQKIIYKEDLPNIFAAFENHVKSRGEVPFLSEARFHHKDGSTVWVLCRGKVIEWGEDGSPLRAVGSHIDITKLKEAEERTKRYSQELESKNKEIQEFAYVASHDLQEPIRTISSFSKLLKQNYEGKLDEQADQSLNFIIDSTERMKDLVGGLLDYSRLGHNKRHVLINCNNTIRVIQDDLKIRIEETGAKFEIDELPEINGIKTEIRLLFQNLISNALKFKSDTTFPLIKISAQQEQGFVKFSVKDNGIGIEDKYKEKIFAIFQRLHNKKEYQGTGIGLAHCKKIVEIHGGEIWVDSTPDQGSTFHFTIKN